MTFGQISAPLPISFRPLALGLGLLLAMGACKLPGSAQIHLPNANAVPTDAVFLITLNNVPYKIARRQIQRSDIELTEGPCDQTQDSISSSGETNDTDSANQEGQKQKATVPQSGQNISGDILFIDVTNVKEGNGDAEVISENPQSDLEKSKAPPSTQSPKGSYSYHIYFMPKHFLRPKTSYSIRVQDIVIPRNGDIIAGQKACFTTEGISKVAEETPTALLATNVSNDTLPQNQSVIVYFENPVDPGVLTGTKFCATPTDPPQVATTDDTSICLYDALKIDPTAIYEVVDFRPDEKGWIRRSSQVFAFTLQPPRKPPISEFGLTFSWTEKGEDSSRTRTYLPPQLQGFKLAGKSDKTPSAVYKEIVINKKPLQSADETDLKYDDAYPEPQVQFFRVDI